MYVLAAVCLGLVAATQAARRRLAPGWQPLVLGGLSFAAYTGAVLAAGPVFRWGWSPEEHYPDCESCLPEPVNATAWQVTFLVWGLVLMLAWPLTRSTLTALAGGLGPVGWLVHLTAWAHGEQGPGPTPLAWLSNQDWVPWENTRTVATMVGTGILAVVLSRLRGWWWLLAVILLPAGLWLYAYAFFGLIDTCC